MTSGSPRSAALFGLAIALSAPCFAAVTLSDSEFGDADWSITTRTGPNTLPVTASASQPLSGGNPGAYRQTVHTVTPSGAGFAFGWIWHLNTAQAHDPSVSPVVSVDHASQHRRISSTTNEGTSTYAVVEQDGNIYFSSANQVTIATSWVSFEASGLTASDFFLLKPDGSGTEASHPDFSATGSELTFGVGFSNTPTSGFVITHAIDNWSVTLDVVPEPSASGLVGLATAMLIWRRRRAAVGSL